MEVESVGTLIADAEKFALENDRMKFQPYFESAEKFCEENNIVIGGKIGVSLLLGEKISKDSWAWDLYCPNAFEVAKRMVETLFEVKSNHVDNRTVTLQTNIKHREFTISIEARNLFKIFALDRYRDVVLTEIMEPVVVKGWFGSNVKVFPHAIVLIDLYQTLYSPAKCKFWEDAYKMSEVVYKGVTEYNGGFDRGIAEDIFLRSLIKDPRIVLVGDHATSRLGIGKRTRIQLLTDIPIEELSAMTSRVLNAEKNQLRRVKVTHDRTSYVKYNLNIPSDFQILKHTVYAIVGGEQVALYDVFNSPTYEMIPYTTVDKIKIASPVVIMRFIFIDIWVLKLIIGIGRYRGGAGADAAGTGAAGTVSTISGSADGGLHSRINALVSLANSVREYILTQLKVDTFKVFPREYIGVNTSEAVAKKKIIANIGYRLPNYYPVLNKE
jgi:hypothetical protein